MRWVPTLCDRTLSSCRKWRPRESVATQTLVCRTRWGGTISIRQQWRSCSAISSTMVGSTSLVAVAALGGAHRGNRRADEGRQTTLRTSIAPLLRLSGTQPMTLRPESNFLMIGERTNVTRFTQVCPPDQRRGLRGSDRDRPRASRGRR